MVIQVTKSGSYVNIRFWVPGYCTGRGRRFSFRWEWWHGLRQCKCHRSLSSHLLQEIPPEMMYQNLQEELVSCPYLAIDFLLSLLMGRIPFTLPLSLPLFLSFPLSPFPFPSLHVTLCCWQQGTAPALCLQTQHSEVTATAYKDPLNQ